MQHKVGHPDSRAPETGEKFGHLFGDRERPIPTTTRRRQTTTGSEDSERRCGELSDAVDSQFPSSGCRLDRSTEIHPAQPGLLTYYPRIHHHDPRKSKSRPTICRKSHNNGQKILWAERPTGTGYRISLRTPPFNPSYLYRRLHCHSSYIFCSYVGD